MKVKYEIEFEFNVPITLKLPENKNKQLAKYNILFLNIFLDNQTSFQFVAYVNNDIDFSQFGFLFEFMFILGRE